MLRTRLRTLWAIAVAIALGTLPPAAYAPATAAAMPASAMAALPLGDPRAADTAACADPSSDPPRGRPGGQGTPLLFDDFVGPLLDAAYARRARLAAEDPGYRRRVDEALNARRLNVALLGYAEEHGQTYEGAGITVSILSLDVDTWDLASISLSRDTRVPELEDPAAAFPRGPVLLRDAYTERGFDGVRTVLEDATGLAIDFQVLMQDVFLRNYLRDVSGPVELVLPKSYRTTGYRLDGVEHGPGFIPGGRQLLSPGVAMAFVLAEEAQPRGMADERGYRRNLLLKALSCQLRQRLAATDAGFTLRLFYFSTGEFRSGSVVSDFDLRLLVGGLARMTQTLAGARGDVDATFPEVGAARQVIVNDEMFGGGGVRRVHRIADTPVTSGVPDHPLVRQEIRLGSLPEHVLIAIGGDPYADDAVTGYWFSVRGLVRTALSNPARR